MHQRRSDTEKVLDFHVGLTVSSTASDVSWYWKKFHEALFAARGGKEPSSVPPEGVRLLDLVFKDVRELESFLDHKFEQLHSNIVNNADFVKAESAISCIEGGCAKLALSLTHWEPKLSELRMLRMNGLGKRNASGYANASEEIFRKFVKSLPSDLYSEIARDLNRLGIVLNTYTPRPIDRSSVIKSSLRNDIYTDAWGEVG